MLIALVFAQAPIVSPFAGAADPPRPLRELPSEILVRAVETSYRLEDPQHELHSLETEYRFVFDDGFFFMSQTGEGWDPDNSAVSDLRIDVLETADESTSVFRYPKRPDDQVANVGSVVETGSDSGFWRESPVPLVTLLLYAPSLLPERHLLAPSQAVDTDVDLSGAIGQIVNYRSDSASATLRTDSEGRPLRIAAFVQSDPSPVFEIDFSYSEHADGSVLPRWTHRFFASGVLISETKAEAISALPAPSERPVLDVPNETLIRNAIERTLAHPVNYWKDSSGNVERLSDEDIEKYSPMRPDRWPHSNSIYGWILAVAFLAALGGVLAAVLWRRRRKSSSM